MCSCDQSLVTVTFLWEKYTHPHYYKDLTRKTAFFERWSWFKFNNLGLVLGTNLKFYTSVSKGLKLKVRKFWGLIPPYVEGTGENLVGRSFCSPPSWIGLRVMSILNLLQETLIRGIFHPIHYWNVRCSKKFFYGDVRSN